jgi:hypothetical protein
MSIPINYIFLRHSNSNGNALHGMISNKLVTLQEANHLVDNVLIDSELSTVGKYASVLNGVVISKVLKEDGIKYINVVGCSTLLRAMLSAYYMTRKWENPPNKIFVLPHLREIDESSSNKWSKQSLYNVDSNSSYRMKSITEQKKILESMGILSFFDFSIIENNLFLRHTLGDIPNFISWSKQILDSVFKKETIPTSFNFYLITHAGVLFDYANSSFINNTGILIKEVYNLKTCNLKKRSCINLRPLLEKNTDFISSYSDMYSISTNKAEFKNLLIQNPME